jgi:hypothetical protein
MKKDNAKTTLKKEIFQAKALKIVCSYQFKVKKIIPAT